MARDPISFAVVGVRKGLLRIKLKTRITFKTRGGFLIAQDYL